MITIITGSINRGKTTKMIKHYQTHQKGDGFVSLKIMDIDHVNHYEAMKLSTQEKKVIMVHELDFLNKNQEETVKIGPYHLIFNAFSWIEDEIRKMIQKKVSPIYLDEIGMLELKGEGFHHILCEMLASKLDLILVVRESLCHDVVSTYQMKDVHFM